VDHGWRVEHGLAVRPRPDPPIVAEDPPRYLPVSLGSLQRGQRRRRDADDLVYGAVAGLLNPRHTGPPRAIALVPFPAQQVAEGAAGHADHRRTVGRLRRHLPRLEQKFDDQPGTDPDPGRSACLPGTPSRTDDLAER
jgi:hypothetical protein